MPLTDQTIDAFAARLDEAAEDNAPITMLTAEEDFSLQEGYDIQRALVKRRLGRGDRLAGMKMGLTSKAKMEQVGVHNPIYGHLTDAMRLMDGATIDLSSYIHARIEPELAFILGKDLRGPTSPAEALLAVEAVCPALEIIDSRYENFEFTLADVVADNASASGFVLGSDMHSPGDELKLGNLGMLLEIDGQIAEVGNSSAIYEHPARSLATQANLLAERGEHLKAGMVVLSGGATKAVFLEPGGHVRVRVDRVGTAELHVAES